MALIGSSTQTRSRSELIGILEVKQIPMPTVTMPKANVDMLAEYFLKNGAMLSPTVNRLVNYMEMQVRLRIDILVTDNPVPIYIQQAMSIIRAWNAHPTMETATLMGTDDAATMMLAMRPRRDSMSLADESKLCELRSPHFSLLFLVVLFNPMYTDA